MSVADERLLEQYRDSSMPPNVIPSEDAVLGAMLLHGPHVARPLIADDFYRGWNGDLFRLITDLYERYPHLPYLDPIAVKDEMFRRGKPHDATPMFLLYDDAISRCAHPGYHVERILESAEARMVQKYGTALAQAGGNPEAVARRMSEMDAAVREFRARAGFDGGREDTRLDAVVRRSRLAAATTPPARPTGLTDLDRVLNGGLRPSTFNVLGARPGVGKSLLAGTIATHIGSTEEARVVYLTMELSAGEIGNRMIADVGGIELTKLQNTDQLSQEDFYAYSLAEEKIDGWPIHIEEGAKTIGQIEDCARGHLGDAPAGLLIVDYLGRIREHIPGASRERHVGIWSSRLTDLSRELRIPILCVVSFSRDSVKRGGPPRMDDIRDSGTVESDADNVMLMWSPESTDPSTVELVVDKNRYGAVDTIRLRKQGHRGRIVSATSGEFAR